MRDFLVATAGQARTPGRLGRGLISRAGDRVQSAFRIVGPVGPDSGGNRV